MEIADLGDALLIVPAGRDSLSALLHRAVEEAGGYGALVAEVTRDEPDALRSPGARLSTTGLWHHRLCRSLANPSVTGTLSRLLGDVPSPVARSTIGAVNSLPPEIGLLSLREFGWPMSEILHAGHHLNLLSLEALAAARSIGAEICLASSDQNDPLLAAAAAMNVAYRLLP